MKIVYFLAGFALILSWLYPDHYLPWTTFGNDYLAFVALLLLWVFQLGVPKQFSVFSFAVFAVVVLVLLQLVTSKIYFAIDAWMAIFYLLGSGAAYQIGLSYGDRHSCLRGLAMLIVCGGIISALLGVAQWLEFVSPWMVTPIPGRSVGNLAQPNNYATLLFWSMCALSFLYLKKTVSLVGYSVIAFVLAFGMIVSESRTPLLQSLFLGVIFLLGVRAGFLRLKDVVVLLPVCLFGFLYFVFPAIDGLVFLKEPSLLGLVERPYSYRLAIWTSLLLPIINSPFLGYGVGQVSVAQFSFLNDFGETVEFVEHSHNILVDIIIWFGPLFGVVLIYFLLFWIGRYFRRLRSTEDWFLFACVGSLIIHGLLEYPLEYAYFLLPFSLMLGLMDNGNVRSGALVRFRYLYGCVLFTLSLVPMSIIWKEHRALEEDHRLMRAQNFGLMRDRSLSLSDDVKLLDGKREYIRFARYEARQNMSEEDLEWMRRVVYRYPFAVSIYRYSVALALNGRESEAHTELVKIKYFFGQKMYYYHKGFFDASVAVGAER